jgi:autotransporter passenger strand-loop-strand repeat protein
MANKEHRPAGGTAWWCCGLMNPVAVYVQGMGYNANGAQYSVATVSDTCFCYTAQEADLFDTEKEAQEEFIRRLDKEKEHLKERLQRIERYRSIAINRIRALETCSQVKDWSDVTTSAVISGSGTTRTNITVVGQGRLYIRDGAVVRHVTVKEGGSCCVVNAHIDNVCAYSNAAISLSGSSTMNYATIDSGSELWVEDESKTNHVDLVGYGIAYVRGSGVVRNTTVCDNGYLNVSGGHTKAFNTTVKSGGHMCISDGAYIEGCLVATKAELTKTAPYTISNLNVISGGLDI